MAKKSSVDLTEGNIYKLLIGFALPLLAGQVFQNLYNSVDSIIVGRFVSDEALAAVSTSSDISMLLTGFFTGLSTGAGIVFARYFGAKRNDELHEAIHTTLSFALTLGVVMVVLGVVFTPALLNMVGCPEEVFVEAESYLRIYLIGILFTSVYNIGAGICRAVGDSGSPFRYLVYSSITNVILDIVFVVWFKMGVMGVAFATICSQGLSVFCVFRKLLLTTDVYKVVVKDLGLLKMKWIYLSQVISLGIPIAIQSSLTSISNLFVQRYINSFGTYVMAGTGAAKKIDKFVGLISTSLGQASATFISQNVGARKTDRVWGGMKAALVICAVGIVVVSVPIFAFAPSLAKVFTENPFSIEAAVTMIRIMVPFYYVQAINQIVSQATRGFGKSSVVMVLSLSGMIVMRQIFLYITMNYIDWNVAFVYVGYPVGWFFSALFVGVYFWFAVYKKYKDGLPENFTR